MNLIEFDEKVLKWIEGHKTKYNFILFVVGVLLGIMSFILLGRNIVKGSFYGVGIGFLFMFINYFMHEY